MSKKVTDMLKTHFDISPEFERVHRVGRPSRQRNRPREIVARFCRYQERDAVYQDRRKLANTGSNIYINEDFCPNTIGVRKEQWDALQEARNQGKTAYFRYRTLVVKENTRNAHPNYNRTHAHRVSAQRTHRSPPPSGPRSPPPSPFLANQTHTPPRGNVRPWMNQDHPRFPVWPCDISVPPPNFRMLQPNTVTGATTPADSANSKCQ